MKQWRDKILGVLRRGPAFTSAFRPLSEPNLEPVRISQIFLTDFKDQALPPALQALTGSVRQAYPNADYTLYNDESLRAFIAQNFDADILWAYDTLRPYAYKSDVGRYCLLHKLGGWYFDIGVELVTPIAVSDETVLLGFRDMHHDPYVAWPFATTILYAKPNHPVFETALRQIVENVRQRHYGISPLCPTGPNMFGAALARHGANHAQLMGDYMRLTPLHQHKNLAFILPDGTMFAWGKKAEGGDLGSLGAKGTNNYNEFWRARRVYAGKPILKVGKR